MPTKIIFRAVPQPRRSNIDVAPVVVVALLTLLFTATILAAFGAHPLVDAAQAAIQGGL